MTLDALPRHRRICSAIEWAIVATMKRLMPLMACWGMLAGSVCAQTTLLTNLEAYYKLDAAGITTDSHSTNTLTNTNSTPTTTGKINEAADFDGATSNRVLFDELAGLNSAPAASYSFWFKRSNSSHTIAVGTRSGSNYFAPIIWTDGICYVDIGGSGNYGQFTHGVGTGSWGHVVVSFDGTQTGNANRLKCYLNGSAATMSYAGSVPAALATNAAQGSFCIGLQSGTRYSTGQIDEVGVWSRALTGSEVTQLYNSGAGLPYSSFGGGGGGNGPVIQNHYRRLRSAFTPTPWDRFVSQTPLMLARE